MREGEKNARAYAWATAFFPPVTEGLLVSFYLARLYLSDLKSLIESQLEIGVVTMRLCNDQK